MLWALANAPTTPRNAQHRRHVVGAVQAAELDVAQVARAQRPVHHARQAQAGGRLGGDAGAKAASHQGHAGQHIFHCLHHVQANALAVKRVRHLLCQPWQRCIGVDDHRLAVQIAQRDFLACAQGMGFRQSNHQCFLQHGQYPQTGLGGYQPVEADGDAALAQRLQLLALGQVVQLYAHLGTCPVEGGQQSGE